MTTPTAPAVLFRIPADEPYLPRALRGFELRDAPEDDAHLVAAYDALQKLDEETGSWFRYGVVEGRKTSLKVAERYARIAAGLNTALRDLESRRSPSVT